MLNKVIERKQWSIDYIVNNCEGGQININNKQNQTKKNKLEIETTI